MGKTCSHFSYFSLIFTAVQDCYARLIHSLKHASVWIKFIYMVRNRESSFAFDADAF